MRVCAAFIPIAIVAALTLHRLGAADICGANEAIEGTFLQQMVEHGQWLFPLENGHAPMYKPPLFHWTATVLDRLVDIRKVDSFNLRITAALYAIAGVALTIAFSIDFLGIAGAGLAGFILCASYQYIEQGRIGRVDMTLCFFETLALFVFMWWYAPRAAPSLSNECRAETAEPDSAPHTGGSRDELSGRMRRDGLRYLFALALGLGVLAKGPVGAILPAAACGIFLVIQRRFRDLAKIAAPGPVLLAAAVGGSWYAACLFAHRYGFLDRQLGSENFGRFLGALGAMAPWYYVKPILLNSAPLSLLVPVAVYFALRSFLRMASDSGPNNPLCTGGYAVNVESLRARQAIGLCSIFWLVTIFFFTLAAYKRRAYLMPLWPVSAVMLAWWVELVQNRYRLTGHVLRGFVVVACAGLIIFNAVYLPKKEVRGCARDSVKLAAIEINRIVGSGEPLYSYGFGDDPAPLLFYLDRNAPPLAGKLGDAPPGYVVTPAAVWRHHEEQALDLTPVFFSSSGNPRIVLLRHGKALAGLH